MKIEVLQRLRQESKALPTTLPTFYTELNEELTYARDVFFAHPLIIRCREDALPFLNDDFGHGIEHSKKVSIEACALILAEGTFLGLPHARRLGLLAMLAGLLHDSCRLEEHHALRGAELALLVLQDYPLSDQEKQMVSRAIGSHEAFSTAQFEHMETQLLAGALYDADKFRWGPDNFQTTLWEICNYQDWSLGQILDKFPDGLKTIKAIQNTFRTTTGKMYGPEFIELGLTMGKKIYQIIQAYLQQSDCVNVANS